MAGVTASLSLLIVYVALAQGRPDGPTYRRRPQMPECVRTARQCMEDLTEKWGHLENLPEFKSFAGNATQLTEFADDLQETVECRRGPSQNPECQEYGYAFNMDMYLSTVGDFLQSPGAIADIVAASSSPCLNNEASASQAARGYEQCAITADREVESGQVCDGVRSFLQCTQQGAERLCGEAVGRLIRRVRTYLLTTPEVNAVITESIGFDLSSCQNLVNIARRSAELARPLLDRFRK